MDIDSILAPERTMGSLESSSKKRAFEMVADFIAQSTPELDIGEVYRGLIEREKLGTTAIGDGVAIPHCRLEGCDSIVGSLFVFDEPMDFSAHDEKPVNILFVLLVPAAETTEHLSTLRMLAERFQQKSYRDSLVSAGSNSELYARAIAPITTSDIKSQSG